MTRTTKKTAILSSLVIVIATSILVLTSSSAYAQFLKSYNKLTKPEQHWVLRHPIAAWRTHRLADTAKKEAIRHLDDKDMDGDINGGMVDAFKHTLWMALNAQKIGKRKSLSLGMAHEESARLEFLADPNRKYITQDSIASRMDVLNNVVGADIGINNAGASYQELVAIVKKAVMDGKCWKIKKLSKNIYVDDKGTPIKTHDYDGQWYIPKVLVPSNK